MHCVTFMTEVQCITFEKATAYPWVIENSNMTCFFSPIKSTDTSVGILTDNHTTAVSHTFHFNQL